MGGVYFAELGFQEFSFRYTELAYLWSIWVGMSSK